MISVGVVCGTTNDRILGIAEFVTGMCHRIEHDFLRRLVGRLVATRHGIDAGHSRDHGRIDWNAVPASVQRSLAAAPAPQQAGH